MLLVHAALLMTVNNAFTSLGGSESGAAMVMIIGGNLGIMMIEGLIVYIQSLRLHCTNSLQNGMLVVHNHLDKLDQN
jgi:V/A-type H+-transporting ATPase subunit I